MLTLLNFWGLLGITAIGIPIVIHWLRFHRKVCEIPSLLLFTAFKRTSMLRRISRLLQLILRCLAILLIALILARPIFRIPAAAPGEFRPGEIPLIVCLDDSARSMLPLNEIPLLDHFKKSTNALLAKLPPNAEIRVLPFSSGILSEPMAPADARSMIDNLQFMPLVRSFHDILPALRAFPESASVWLAAFPSPDLLRECAAFEKNRPDTRWNLPRLAADNPEPDVFFKRTSFLPDGTLSVRFGGNPARLATMTLRIDRTDSETPELREISPAAILSGELRIPHAASTPLTLSFRSRTRLDASPLAVRHLVPPGKEKSASTEILLLYDTTPRSRAALRILFTVFDFLKNEQSGSITMVRTDTPLSTDLTGRNFSLAVPVPSERNLPEIWRKFLSEHLRSGTNLLLFPNAPAIPGVPNLFRGNVQNNRVDGLFPASTRIPGDFAALPGEGLSAAHFPRIVPIAPLNGVHPLLRNGKETVFAALTGEHPAGTVYFCGIPLHPIPVSFVMNPAFPHLMAICAGLSDGSDETSSTNFPEGVPIPLPDAFPALGETPGLCSVSGPGLPKDGSTFYASPDAPYLFTPETSGHYRIRRNNPVSELAFAVNSPQSIPEKNMEPPRDGNGVLFHSAPAPENLRVTIPATPKRDQEKNKTAPHDLHDLLPYLIGVLLLLFAAEMILVAWQESERRAGE